MKAFHGKVKRIKENEASVLKSAKRSPQAVEEFMSSQFSLSKVTARAASSESSVSTASMSTSLTQAAPSSPLPSESHVFDLNVSLMTEVKAMCLI